MRAFVIATIMERKQSSVHCPKCPEVKDDLAEMIDHLTICHPVEGYDWLAEKAGTVGSGDIFHLAVLRKQTRAPEPLNREALSKA